MSVLIRLRIPPRVWQRARRVSSDKRWSASYEHHQRRAGVSPAQPSEARPWRCECRAFRRGWAGETPSLLSGATATVVVLPRCAPSVEVPNSQLAFSDCFSYIPLSSQSAAGVSTHVCFGLNGGAPYMKRLLPNTGFLLAFAAIIAAGVWTRADWTARSALCLGYAELVAASPDEGKDKPATPAEQYRTLQKEFSDAAYSFTSGWATPARRPSTRPWRSGPKRLRGTLARHERADFWLCHSNSTTRYNRWPAPKCTRSATQLVVPLPRIGTPISVQWRSGADVLYWA